METFSALLALCAGNSPWINGSVNNNEAGGLRRHRAHYDVIVMLQTQWTKFIAGCLYTLIYVFCCDTCNTNIIPWATNQTEQVWLFLMQFANGVDMLFFSIVVITATPSKLLWLIISILQALIHWLPWSMWIYLCEYMVGILCWSGTFLRFYEIWGRVWNIKIYFSIKKERSNYTPHSLYVVVFRRWWCLPVLFRAI